jgi:hypothetical protein
VPSRPRTSLPRATSQDQIDFRRPLLLWHHAGNLGETAFGPIPALLPELNGELRTEKQPSAAKPGVCFNRRMRAGAAFARSFMQELSMKEQLTPYPG